LTKRSTGSSNAGLGTQRPLADLVRSAAGDQRRSRDSHSRPDLAGFFALYYSPWSPLSGRRRTTHSKSTDRRDLFSEAAGLRHDSGCPASQGLRSSRALQHGYREDDERDPSHGERHGSGHQSAEATDVNDGVGDAGIEVHSGATLGHGKARSGRSAMRRTAAQRRRTVRTCSRPRLCENTV
jgi:hypothetical protein